MQHKHRDVIVAWDDGKDCQYRQDSSRPWNTLTRSEDCPRFSVDFEYRIKPEPLAKVYPVTAMSPRELFDVFRKSDEAEVGSLVDVANAAIRHAIDSGQVIIAPKGE